MKLIAENADRLFELLDSDAVVWPEGVAVLAPSCCERPDVRYLNVTGVRIEEANVAGMAAMALSGAWEKVDVGPFPFVAPGVPFSHSRAVAAVIKPSRPGDRFHVIVDGTLLGATGAEFGDQDLSFDACVADTGELVVEIQPFGRRRLPATPLTGEIVDELRRALA